MKSKLTSRKFWLAAAAGLASIGGSIAGLAIQNEVLAGIGIGCTVASAAIYAAAEAYVDGKAVASSTTITETKVSASATGSTANDLVAATIAPQDAKASGKPNE